MYVSFITDAHFKACVRYVLSSYSNAVNLRDSISKSIDKGDIFKSDLFSNVVDPFKMTFDIQKIGLKEWVNKEVLRQLDKSVEQKMGEFHQRLLGGIDGWVDLGIGHEVDLMKEDKTVYLEIKNKYNTCSSDALKGVRGKLEEITKENHQAVGYWAYIISNTVQKSGVEVWVKRGFNQIDAIRKIWGEEVYSLVTGQEKALEQVYNILPTVIRDVVKEDEIEDLSFIINQIALLIEPFLDEIKERIYREVF
ncbi:MAG: Eco47II family restriction endonuclease [Bacteroidales bacterium]|nr:Eco47II family restriction endonuclease [Bacteroidales bacterium]